MNFFQSWRFRKTIDKIYEKSEQALIDSLEKNIYGPHEGQSLFIDNGIIIFQPSTISDHLATQFLRLPPVPCGSISRWISFQFFQKYPENNIPACTIEIQDENFMLVKRICLSKNPEIFHKNLLEYCIEIPGAVTMVRLVLSAGETKAIVPNSINITKMPFSSINSIRCHTSPSTIVHSISDDILETLQFLNEEQLGLRILDIPKNDIKKYYADDPWILNYLINNWEFFSRKTTLTSYPYNVAFAISGNCNADCIFCITRDLRDKYRNRTMSANDWKKFAPLLKFSRTLGIPGPGEPLLHPELEELLTNLKQFLDPRCKTYIITNGVLIDKKMQCLRNSLINIYDISLNAASAETHSRVMKLPRQAFERVRENICSLVDLRSNGRKDISINITFVVNNENIHEMAEFIKLGNELNVDGIFLRPLEIKTGGSNQEVAEMSRLDPTFNPELSHYVGFLQKEMKNSRVPVYAKPELWERKNVNFIPHSCSLLYNNLYLHNDFFKIWPCCIIGNLGDIHPVDFDGTTDFFKVWNCPMMINLRRSLLEGPMNEYCRKCNIDLKTNYKIENPDSN